MRRILLLLRRLLRWLPVRSLWRIWTMRRQPGRLPLRLWLGPNRLLRIGNQGGVRKQDLPGRRSRIGKMGAAGGGEGRVLRGGREAKLEGGAERGGEQLGAQMR